MPENCKFKTSVGGQAVMEGIMMQGPNKWCLAVRTPKDGIVTEVHDTKKRPLSKVPLVRGVISFIASLISGYKIMMRSAELALDGDEEYEEEPSKLDLWVDKHFGEKGAQLVMWISGALGVALAVGLFMVLPTGAVSLLGRVVPVDGVRSLLEGVLKIAIFIVYLALVSRMKEIRRVFSYHGAEHKTIACYEAGEELTVENVRTKSRLHPRCSTSFLLIVIVISILVNGIIPWNTIGLRVVFKLLLLPLVMGISFEILRLCGRYTNPLTRAVSAPGMWMQKLTTNEPDDEMIEVAIAAVTPVLPEKPEDAKW